LALAEISADVPFSVYGPVDRIFTLLEGKGLDLSFEGGAVLPVPVLFDPKAFACDVPCSCRVRNGPCRALNLFVARGVWRPEVAVLPLRGMESLRLDGAVGLFMALRGKVVLSGAGQAITLAEGDAGQVDGLSQVDAAAGDALLYVAILVPAGQMVPPVEPLF
jgi:environmental stress-induced protein Ves